MKVLILSVNHRDQVAPITDEIRIPKIMEKKEKVRTLVKEMVGRRDVDLICEESDPCKLSIAQEEAFNHRPRIPWKNISMTSQERLEVGIWEALLYRPVHLTFQDERHAIQIEHRVPEDDVREDFFRDEILKTAKATAAKSVLILCGDMHTEALQKKLENALGHKVDTNRELTPEKQWQ